MAIGVLWAASKQTGGFCAGMVVLDTECEDLAIGAVTNRLRASPDFQGSGWGFSVIRADLGAFVIDDNLKITAGKTTGTDANKRPVTPKTDGTG